MFSILPRDFQSSFPRLWGPFQVHHLHLVSPSPIHIIIIIIIIIINGILVVGGGSGGEVNEWGWNDINTKMRLRIRTVSDKKRTQNSY